MEVKDGSRAAGETLENRVHMINQCTNEAIAAHVRFYIDKDGVQETIGTEAARRSLIRKMLEYGITDMSEEIARAHIRAEIARRVTLRNIRILEGNMPADKSEESASGE